MSDAPQWPELVTAEAEFRAALATARAAKSDDALQQIRSEYFGPKGRMTLLLRSVGKLSPELRPTAGKEANRVRKGLEAELDEAIEDAKRAAREAELSGAPIDLSLPARRTRPQGTLHPVSLVIRDLVSIFGRMGFEVATGPEVEQDWYNFTALNFPPDHPARDMQDTFFVQPPTPDRVNDLVLRTHTSPVQIRSMLADGAPIRIISPGRVFRCDQDKTHSPMFHQIEGLWVDEGVSFAHLKGVLQSFINAMFGERKVRFRPSFFPFVEPGVEVDVECVLCDGAGCATCKDYGWMEILGAGMVHPNVLEACNIDPERYTGFAFGLGIDRIAMLRWHVDDLGHMFRSDLRFLEQIR